MEQLIQILEAQVARPTRAVVNSEGRFVFDKLNEIGLNELASRYWRWYCGRVDVEFEADQDVVALTRKLKAIDAGISMPNWGTRGT